MPETTAEVRARIMEEVHTFGRALYNKKGTPALERSETRLSRLLDRLEAAARKERANA